MSYIQIQFSWVVFQDEGIVCISLWSSGSLGLYIYNSCRGFILYSLLRAIWEIYKKNIFWFLCKFRNVLFFPLPLWVQSRMDRKPGESEFLLLTTVTGNIKWLKMGWYQCLLVNVCQSKWETVWVPSPFWLPSLYIFWPCQKNRILFLFHLLCLLKISFALLLTSKGITSIKYQYRYTITYTVCSCKM